MCRSGSLLTWCVGSQGGMSEDTPRHMFMIAFVCLGKGIGSEGVHFLCDNERGIAIVLSCLVVELRDE